MTDLVERHEPDTGREAEPSQPATEAGAAVEEPREGGDQRAATHVSRAVDPSVAGHTAGRVR
jgi:hypothetical protein